MLKSLKIKYLLILLRHCELFKSICMRFLYYFYVWVGGSVYVFDEKFTSMRHDFC